MLVVFAHVLAVVIQAAANHVNAALIDADPVTAVHQHDGVPVVSDGRLSVRPLVPMRRKIVLLRRAVLVRQPVLGAAATCRRVRRRGYARHRNALATVVTAAVVDQLAALAH